MRAAEIIIIILALIMLNLSFFYCWWTRHDISDTPDISNTLCYKKYEFTGETCKTSDNVVLKRIRALVDIDLGDRVVKAGELGGWIESERNLSHDGFAWIGDNASVRDDARVTGDALVCGDALVMDDARIFDNARVSDNAIVREHAQVFGHAKVREFAVIRRWAKIYDYAIVYGRARVASHSYVYGNARVGSGVIEGVINKCPSPRWLPEKDDYVDWEGY